MIVLGIETSCDECALSLINEDNHVLGNQIASQIAQHQAFGGVAPEVASRLHITQIVPTLNALLTQSKINLTDIDLVACTNRPGLMGSLLVGATFAKNLAWALNKPFIAVHHLLAHLFVAKQLYSQQLAFPFLGVVASGGHTALAIVEGYEEHQVKILGTTLDDAIGEAFDKVAKAYGLPYPGGPHIDSLAQQGNAKAFHFPKPKLNPKYAGAYDLSYSGLKNAVINQRQQFLKKDQIDNLENILASFQRSAVDQLIGVIEQAAADFALKQVVIGGGVAANSYLKQAMQGKADLEFFSLPAMLCGDNGQMVAYYGKQLYLARGKQGDTLNSGVYSRAELFKYKRPK